jgi:hypothetical protein
MSNHSCVSRRPRCTTGAGYVATTDDSEDALTSVGIRYDANPERRSRAAGRTPLSALQRYRYVLETRPAGERQTAPRLNMQYAHSAPGTPALHCAAQYALAAVGRVGYAH